MRWSYIACWTVPLKRPWYLLSSKSHVHLEESLPILLNAVAFNVISILLAHRSAWNGKKSSVFPATCDGSSFIFPVSSGSQYSLHLWILKSFYETTLTNAQNRTSYCTPIDQNGFMGKGRAWKIATSVPKMKTNRIQTLKSKVPKFQKFFLFTFPQQSEYRAITLESLALALENVYFFTNCPEISTCQFLIQGVRKKSNTFW